MKKKSSPLETHFSLLLLADNIEGFVREFSFHPTRRWKFDFAHPGLKIAVEIEGGIWSNGRHVRGKGYQEDAIKYNEAVKLGWRLLRYTGKKEMRSFQQDWLTLTRGAHEEDSI